MIKYRAACTSLGVSYVAAQEHVKSRLQTAPMKFCSLQHTMNKKRTENYTNS